MVNHRFCHKIIIIVLILSIFSTSCFASTTSNVIDAMKNLSTVDELYNYIKTTFGSDGSNVTNTFLNAILQTLKTQFSTPNNIVWVDFATKNVMGISGDFRDYMYRDSNTQTSTYVKLREFYDRYYTYSDGNAALLNQINTNTVNMYGSQSASNVQLASLNHINWENTNSYLKRIVGADGTTNPSKYPYNQQYIDFVFDTISTSYNTENLFSVELPIQYWNTATATSYVDHIDIVYGTVTQSINYQIFYYPGQLGLNIYASYLPLSGGSVSEFSVRVYLKGNISYSSPETYIKYISKYNIDYLLENYYLLMNDLKDGQSDIIDIINNKTIEAELDNSIGNDDITINEGLPSGGLLDSARVITRVKSQFGTNVSVLDFLSNYNVSDLSGWFSSDNANVVQSINSSYTDLYD